MADEPAPTHDEAAAALGQRLTAQLLALLEERGVSRSELARRLGTSPAYVTKILRGDANFTLASLVKLAEALEAELEIELRSAASPTAGLPPRAAAGAPRGSRRAAILPAPQSDSRPVPPKAQRDGGWRVW